jgi:hypothetical protein
MQTRLYAYISSDRAKLDKEELLSVAHQFSARIETLDDGVLFDVSGLERLIGTPEQIAENILAHLKTNNISGNVAVADTVDTAILLARQKKGLNHTIASPAEFQKLPLRDLGMASDSVGIFNELGIKNIEQLRQVPVDDLINRYGQDFQKVIDVIEQNDKSFLTPNVKESNVAWNYDLDFPVDDFEQLIFVINHGLDNLLGQIDHYGLSTEQLDIGLKLSNKTEKNYEIKTSFPTLEKTFWLKLINLRVSLDPPEAAIVSVKVVSYFTKPRSNQKGLYAVSRPEPESLLLTVNKIKKLVGEDNVGIPVLLNQRLSEPFTLDPDAMPDVRTENVLSKIDHVSSRLSRSICGEACFAEDGKNDPAAMPPCPKCGGTAASSFPAGTEKHSFSANRAAKPQTSNPSGAGIIAFIYYHPPLRAEVLVRDGRLVFIKTRDFSGHVREYSGVWKANSKWWDKSWRAQEWDVEVENNGVYRLCKVDKEWFLAGEYD